MAEQKKKKNQAAFGCLFWIACILLIIVVFFLRRDAINEVLKKTGFFEKVFNNTTEIGGSIPDDEDFIPLTVPQDTPPAPVYPPADTTQPSALPPPEERPITVVTDGLPTEPQKPPSSVPPETAPPVQPSGETAVPPSPPSLPSPPPAAVSPPPAAAVPVKTRDMKLYFIEIDSDGHVVRRSAVRKTPVSDTPLMDTLQTLFNGPNRDESGKGLMTLIPPGTRVISGAVKNGVATINISEDFRFSHYGAEGLIGQLMQVVYTATEFPTVSSVQILIEGQRTEYLSGDGIWIGTPLSRESF